MVEPEASVADAAEVLDGEGVGAVLVGRPGELVGVLSERDVVRLVAQHRDLDAMLVRDAMTSPVVQLRPDDTLLEAALRAVDIGVRHLPVVGDLGVEGVVSTRDLVVPLLLEALAEA
jgi:CBS domain-containing protein